MSASPGPWVIDGYRIYGPKDGRSKHANGRCLIGGVVDDMNDWRHQPSDTRDEKAAFRDETTANIHQMHATPELVAALQDYVHAQSRMLDKWADGDDNVKRDIWKALHACEDAGRAALAKARGAS